MREKRGRGNFKGENWIMWKDERTLRNIMRKVRKKVWIKETRAWRSKKKLGRKDNKKKRMKGKRLLK